MKNIIDFDQLEEVRLIFNDRKIRVKVEIDKDESVKSFKEKIENILKIDLTHEYNIFIKQFVIQEHLGELGLKELCKSFDCNEIEVKKKLLNIIKIDRVNMNAEIGVYTDFSSQMKNYSNLGKLEWEIRNKLQKYKTIEETELCLNKIYDDLLKLEGNLRNYCESIIIPKMKNRRDSSSLNSNTNSNSTINKNEENSIDTDASHNSGESVFNKLKDNFLKIKQEKENILRDKTDKLLVYKKLEKLSLNVCKDNEILTNELDKLDNIRDNKNKFIDKLTEREEKLYERTLKGTFLLYKYMKDKNKMDNNSYFQKLKLNYCRVRKYKKVFKLVNEKLLLIFDMNTLSPKDSELVYRLFKDKCGFDKIYKEKVEKKNELQLNLGKKLIIVIDKQSFIYSFKTNEMKILTPNLLKDNHVGGNLLYVPFDCCFYCISGKNSYTIEKLKLPQNIHKDFSDLEEKWSTVISLDHPRAYFCSFIVNKKIIYNILGYNHMKNEYCSEIQKIDISQPIAICTSIKYADNYIPRLSLCGCIKIMNDSVYILGGIHKDKEKNQYVYLFDSSKNTMTKCDFIIKTNFELYETIRLEDSNNTLHSSTNFLNESNFIPLKFDLSKDDHAFYYCMYDTSGFIHMLNVKTLRHLMICQEDKDELWEEDSEDERDLKVSPTKKTSYLNTLRKTSSNLNNLKTKRTWDSEADSECLFSNEQTLNENNPITCNDCNEEEINFKFKRCDERNKDTKISQISEIPLKAKPSKKVSFMSSSSSSEENQNQPESPAESNLKRKIVKLNTTTFHMPTKQPVNSFLISINKSSPPQKVIQGMTIDYQTYTSKTNIDSINTDMSIDSEGDVNVSINA